MKGHINTFSDGEQEGSPSGPPAEIPVGTELSCAGLGPAAGLGDPPASSAGATATRRLQPRGPPPNCTGPPTANLTTGQTWSGAGRRRGALRSAQAATR